MELSNSAKHAPSVYAKARIRAIEHLINTLPAEKDKNSPRELLKQGCVHISLKPEFIKLVERFSDEETNRSALTFSEITKYSTWFYLHPEKQAGKEVVTTSRDFPLRIEGTKEDVIKAIENGLKKPHKANDEEMEKALALSKALKLKLKLYKHKKSKGNISGTFSGILPGTNNKKAGVGAAKKRFKNGTQSGPHLPTLDPHTYQLLKTSTFKKGTVSGLGKLPTKQPAVFSFDEIDELYNSGISKEEKQAWVHYQKNKGEKMQGWDKYNPGKLDIPKAKKLMDAGALFYHNNDYLPYPIYTYANIYDRTLQLEKDKEHIISVFGETAYQSHVKALNEVKPKEISIQAPDAKDRPKILAISKFATDTAIFKINRLDDALVDIELPSKSESEGVSLQEGFSAWMKKLDDTSFKNVTPYDIQQYYLDARRYPKHLTEAEKENIEQFAPQEGEELFARFLYEALTPEDRVKLTFTWNRLYNGQSSVQYQRIPVGFECSRLFKTAPLQITPIQREGIAFMTAVGSGIIAYDVGVGKTMTAIIDLANALYSGKCKRPVIVVPNQTYGKWLRELFGYTDKTSKQFVSGVLSGTDYTVNEWYNLGSDSIKKLDLAKKVPEKSITVLTYEGFMRLGFSDYLMDNLFAELSDIINQVDAENPDTKRDIAKANQKLMELIGRSNKDTVASVDELGFDFICVDEAHNFKNVFHYVPTDDEGNKRFQVSGGQSARAQKMFFITNYIQRTYGSNVMMLTATPFTNNPLEIYSMLAMVGYDNLQKYGLYNLFDFMERFINQSYEYVMSYQGDIVKKHVVKSFNNRLILQKLIYNHINYKTGEEANVKRPCKISLPRTTKIDAKTGLAVKLPPDEQLVTYLKMTDKQAEYQASINHYPDTVSKFQKMAAIMRCLSWSLDNALSPYIYDKSFPETAEEFVNNSPKIKYTIECIRSVKEWHQKRGEAVSGQVIYMNRGKDYFKYIVDYLIENVGFNPSVKFKNTTVSEVEIITSEISQSRREIIKEAFLAGFVKVIIGTATIREGIDLQENGSVLYNCYPDWNPTDAKQLEGRIWRQGNKFGYVRIVMPLVQDSMDVFVFQKLEEKTNRINDIWYRSDRGNVLDLESLDTEEVKFALYTNIQELAKIVLEKETRELDNQIKIIHSQMETINNIEANKNGLLRYRGECKQYLDNWINSLQSFIDFPTETYSYRWNKTHTEIQEYKEKASELIKDIQGFKSNSQQDDRELLSLHRKLAYSVFETKNIVYIGRNDFDMLKTYMGAIAKAEKTVFAAKGYSLDTNFETIKEKLIEEQNRLEKQYAELASDENLNRIYEDIIRKKAKMKIDGREPKQAAEDFASLNHLLAHKFNPVNNSGCIIPMPGTEPSPPNDESKEKAIALAKALKLKIKIYKYKLSA